MATNTLTLFCLISGEHASRAFPVEVSSDKTVGALKKAIIGEKPNTFEHIDANDLVLWCVTVPVDEDAEDEIITAAGVDAKRLLKGTGTLSRAFKDVLSDTIHVLIERPQGVDPEVAVLRKQLSDMLDGSIKLGIIVKPEKKVAFTWPAIVETATLDDLRKNIFNEFPQYAHDEYLEIFVYDGQTKPARICDDEDLRKILKIAKTASEIKLTISLETPSKSFGAWTFKDVCEEYGLSEASDPQLEALPPFDGIQSYLLESDFEKATQDLLIKEIEARVDVLPLRGGNEATKSMVVASFLVAATRLFKDDLYLMSQRELSGRRGNGPVDFSVHPWKTHEYTLGVTEVKRENFQQGVAQNIVQLESALTTKKRKRGMRDVDGEEGPPSKQRAYGIVTDSEKWAFVECTMHEDEKVSFKMGWLDESLNTGGSWKDDAKKIFAKIVWLWSLMRNEIDVCDRHSRKTSSPPSNRKTIL